ncbi:hypothetical protein ACQPW3_10730 [Actinosynnema sp. CA-248983]
MTTPVTTEAAPLPHPNADPDFAVARQAQADLPGALASARSHPAHSDLQKAEAVAEVHATYTATVGAAADRLNARGKTRADWLSAQLPTGHGIPDGAPAAERAALMAVFRGHYEKAVEVGIDDRAKLLDDADRFGDEPARRAVLTAILERGELQTLRARPDRYATVLAYIDELATLSNGGGSTYRGFARQAFTLAPPPPEVARLPVLRQEREEQLAQWRAAGHRV